MTTTKHTLRQLLEHIEGKIDLSHVQQVRNRLLATIKYQEIVRPPVFCFLPYEGKEFMPYPYEEAFGDPAKMMVNELLSTGRTSLYHQVDLKDDSLYCIEANFGAAIPASMFGAQIKVSGNEYPWVVPLDQKAIQRIIDAPPPDPRLGLGQRVIDQIDFFNAMLADYPRCRAAIGIEFPDPQGPFGVAAQLWGPEIYAALLDQAETVRALMSRITDTMVAAYHLFLPKVREHTGLDWHYSQDTLQRGKLCVRNDSAVLVSPRAYAELIQPFDQQLAHALEGISMHFCGDGTHLLDSFFAIRGMQGLDFGQGTMLDMDLIYSKAVPRRVPLVRAAVPEEQLTAKGLSQRFPTGASFLYRAVTVEKAHKMWDRYRSSA